MKHIVAAGLAGLLSLTALSTLADSKEEDAIKYRKAVFTAIKWNFGPMGAMVKGKMPYDKDQFAKRAANVAMLSQLAAEGFVPGSDTGKTDAKPEVWSEPDKFKAGMEKFEQEAQKLADVAKGGDLNAIKPQFAAAGKTCKACHDHFKKD